MMSFNRYVTITLLALSSLISADCPVTCSGVTGAAPFCSIVAGALCVTGNARIGGNLEICGNSFAAGFSNPNSLSNTGLVTSGGTIAVLPSGLPVAVTLTNMAPSRNVNHPNASDFRPLTAGTYLVNYYIELSAPISGAANGSVLFSIAFNGVTVPGSQFVANSAFSADTQWATMAGQAIITITDAQILANSNLIQLIAQQFSGTTQTLTGQASLTIEKIA